MPRRGRTPSILATRNRVCQGRDQRRFGSDHHQADRVVAAEGHDGLVVCRVERGAFGMLCDAGIARGPIITACRLRRLRQLPAQRMLAPAAEQSRYSWPALSRQMPKMRPGSEGSLGRQRRAADGQRNFAGAQAHRRGPVRFRPLARRAVGGEARGVGCISIARSRTKRRCSTGSCGAAIPGDCRSSPKTGSKSSRAAS